MVKGKVMQIGAFVKASGLSRTTVRYYERCGLLKPSTGLNGNSYRIYGPELIERAQMIRLAQSLGFSIKEIIRLMHASENNRLSSDDQRHELERKLAEIRHKRASLLAMECYIEAKLVWLANGGTGQMPKMETVNSSI
jgi:MerR family transcriptional regulator, copper efflux regulator